MAYVSPIEYNITAIYDTSVFLLLYHDVWQKVVAIEYFYNVLHADITLSSWCNVWT